MGTRRNDFLADIQSFSCVAVQRGTVMSTKQGGLPRDPYNVIITGVGGQGNVVLSRILGTMLTRREFTVTIGESFGAAQRGGSVMSHIRISMVGSWSPIIPKGRADVVVALEPVEGIRMMTMYGNPATLALLNTRPLYPSAVTAGDQWYPSPEEIAKLAGDLSANVRFFAATEEALKLGNPVLGNIIMLGAFVELAGLPLDGELFREVISELLPGGKQEDNLRAFELGTHLVRDAGQGNC
jgi:indolepyruvate ferredoxin oxidoreductase, beta subunit